MVKLGVIQIDSESRLRPNFQRRLLAFESKTTRHWRKSRRHRERSTKMVTTVSSLRDVCSETLWHSADLPAYGP